MAHDYANRSKKRKPAARRTQAKAAPSGSGKMGAGKRAALVLMLCLLLIGFAFGLYRLALVKPDPEVTQETIQQSAKTPETKTASKKEETEAAQKKEDFKFYQLLPQSEVEPPEVEAYKSTPKSAKNYSKYLLQAGSFKSAADADSLRAQLILAGMPNVTTSTVTSSSGTLWYRVRVGPFESRSQLNKAQDQLVRMNLQPMEIKLP